MRVRGPHARGGKSNGADFDPSSCCSFTRPQSENNSDPLSLFIDWSIVVLGHGRFTNRPYGRIWFSILFSTLDTRRSGSRTARSVPRGCVARVRIFGALPTHAIVALVGPLHATGSQFSALLDLRKSKIILALRLTLKGQDRDGFVLGAAGGEMAAIQRHRGDR